MVSALLAMLTWTTPGQTPLGRKSGFSQHWFLCAGFLLVKDISLSMDCYAAMGPSVLQSSTCRAYIWNESKLPKILVTAFFDHSFSHNFSHVISVGRYLRWWKVCRKRWFFWSESLGIFWWNLPPVKALVKLLCRDGCWMVCGIPLVPKFLHQLLPQQRV